MLSNLLLFFFFFFFYFCIFSSSALSHVIASFQGQLSLGLWGRKQPKVPPGWGAEGSQPALLPCPTLSLRKAARERADLPLNPLTGRGRRTRGRAALRQAPRPSGRSGRPRSRRCAGPAGQRPFCGPGAPGALRGAAAGGKRSWPGSDGGRAGLGLLLLLRGPALVRAAAPNPVPQRPREESRSWPCWSTRELTCTENMFLPGTKTIINNRKSASTIGKTWVQKNWDE